MTITQLIKRLERIRSEQGNVRVCANAEELWDSCNRVWDVVDIKSVDFQIIEQVDGDGFHEIDSKGRAKSCRTVVLGAYAPTTTKPRKGKRK